MARGQLVMSVKLIHLPGDLESSGESLKLIDYLFLVGVQESPHKPLRYRPQSNRDS